jgi:hypothetical protein
MTVSTPMTPDVAAVFEEAEMIALAVNAFVTVAGHTATSLTLDPGRFVIGKPRREQIVDCGASHGITVTILPTVGPS